jgi:hypothetical protein
MKTRPLIFIILSLLLSPGARAQENPIAKMNWNGYAQLRLTTNFDETHSFSLRRMKLWLNSTPSFSDHWGYHLQTTITSNQNEKFLLQDVMAFYKSGAFRINFGQFVPQFSLQRFQSDHTLPLAERSDAINALVPNGSLGVRDIGAEAAVGGPDRGYEVWLGVFNGNGIKEYRLSNSGFLLTQKTAFTLIDKHLYAGYSLMYRKADHLQLSGLLPDTVIFSGNDTRLNLFARYTAKTFEVQSEYLLASLNGQKAEGWYVMGTLNLGKNQVALSWNQYTDLIASTPDTPAIHLAYSYRMKGDKLKIMLDNGVHLDNGKMERYFAALQLQLFFI